MPPSFYDLSVLADRGRGGRLKGAPLGKRDDIGKLRIKG
jgi:hypothetical protein